MSARRGCTDGITALLPRRARPISSLNAASDVGGVKITSCTIELVVAFCIMTIGFGTVASVMQRGRVVLAWAEAE